MITFSMLGHPRRGRLGNQLFQIASTVGIADKLGHEPVFPAWPYAKYFASPWPTAGRLEVKPVAERHFHYDPTGFTGADHFDVDGWRQSEKYWEHCRDRVRKMFSFDPGLIKHLQRKFSKALSKPCIAISVRRGDFVGNPNYAQLPAAYYYLTLFDMFPNWRDSNVILFSDDMGYCRVHFEGLPNVYFADGSDIEQLALMSLCHDFIVSNSTFSWWGAYLGEKFGSRVIRPKEVFAGPLKAQHSEHDYWPDRWEVLDHGGARLNLSDVTFTIPIFIDHNHRRQNVELNVCMLQRALDTNIMIGEQGKQEMKRMEQYGEYHFFQGMRNFHRTKMLNDMAKIARTPIVVNWDCDVFVPPVQLWLAAQRIRAGEDMVYPYDGRFARVPREWFPKLQKALDLGIFGDTRFKGKHGAALPTTSVGGAIMFNRQSFLNGGGENEHMISFGPEDWERNHRFKALGYQVSRVAGSLYHLDHWIGPNSSGRNPYFKHNHNELDRVRAMTPDELDGYVSGWDWRP
jgi:hypothetical protein